MSIDVQLKTILGRKPQIDWEHRPVDMVPADWCWQASGGFMAIWDTGRAAVSWDGGKPVFGSVAWDEGEVDWIVEVDWMEADKQDMAYRYYLDGQEV